MFKNTIEELNREFQKTVEILSLSLKSDSSDEAKNTLKIIEVLKQNIQIMLRLESDVKNNNQLNLSEDEISKIADYALNLLDEVSISCASHGMQNEMLTLHKLSLPITFWLKQYGGKLSKLDIVVNAIANYANTLQDKHHLSLLCYLIEDVVSITDSSIKQDLEASNPMRPWRILNLNWGIVATRTHDSDLMARVFEQLIQNVPAEAQQFFNEGMQQMDIVGYPESVRIVMKKYADGVGTNSILH